MLTSKMQNAVFLQLLQTSCARRPRCCARMASSDGSPADAVASASYCRFGRNVSILRTVLLPLVLVTISSMWTKLRMTTQSVSLQ